MGRGMLTDSVQTAAKAKLGREISQTELRLMPYVHYCLVNDQNISPNNINQGERDILSMWRADKWITGGASNLRCTKEFWDAINHIMWYGYVEYE